MVLTLMFQWDMDKPWVVRTVHRKGQRRLGCSEETGMNVPGLQTPCQHHLMYGLLHRVPENMP